MPYNYAEERKTLFTEGGVRQLIAVRESAEKLLAAAGAFAYANLSVSGSSWQTLAALEYLCELRVLRACGGPGNNPVYTRA
jgi:hypothetical protein